MKKIFSTIGILTLISFSFFISEQTALVVKDQDDIMIKLKEVENNYKIEVVEPIINEDTIIPGINGLEVNINKSYSEMKKIGTFSENLLEFNNIIPKTSITNTYNKYIISGNTEKQSVSLIFLLEDNDDINSITSILKDTKANFFVNLNWLENNTNSLNNNYIFATTSENNYFDPTFIWSNSVIKRTLDQNINYCYTEEKNIDLLENCTLQKNLTIMPTIKYNSINDIKENIANGSIIALPYSNKLIEELEVIINYINSKGYEIVDLNDLLSEKR